MRRKPENRIAVLAGSLSAIAASSLLLSRGMGVYRHYLLIGVAIGCGALLTYVSVVFNRRRNYSG